MKVWIYLLEWVGTFFAIWGLNVLSRKLLSKKFNAITTIFLTFLIDAFLVFLAAPFLLSFPHPAAFYLPILFLFLVLNLFQVNR
jgi:hypothetical protein